MGAIGDVPRHIAGNVTAVVHSIRDAGGKYGYCKCHKNNSQTTQKHFLTTHKSSPFPFFVRRLNNPKNNRWLQRTTLRETPLFTRTFGIKKKPYC
jgi:hypothetical protein